MEPRIRMRWTSVIWLVPIAVLVVALSATWIFRSPNLGVGSIIMALCGLGLALTLLGKHLLGLAYWAKAMIIGGRWVVFADRFGWIEYLSPRLVRFNREDVASYEVHLPGRRNEYIEISTTAGGTHKIPTGHFEGGRRALMSLLSR